MRLIAILTFLMIPVTLFGQTVRKNANIFELNFGLGTTYHHGFAKKLFETYDGENIPTYQEKRKGNSFQIQYFKEIKNGHSLGLNISHTEFKFFEEGNIYNWGKFTGMYEQDRIFRFLGVGLVYNYSLPINKLGNLDLGADIGHWGGAPPLKFRFLRFLFQIPGSGFKSRFNISYSHRIFEKVNLKLGGYYITALNSHLGPSYLPYSYGIYLGAQYRVEKLFNRRKK